MSLPRRLERGTTKSQPSRPPSRRLAALGGAVAIAAGLVAASPSVASAADATTPLSGIGDTVDVAAGGGQVFVAGGGQIVFANAQGALTGAITGLSGAVGLAVTPSGDRRCYQAPRSRCPRRPRARRSNR